MVGFSVNLLRKNPVRYERTNILLSARAFSWSSKVDAGGFIGVPVTCRIGMVALIVMTLML